MGRLVPQRWLLRPLHGLHHSEKHSPAARSWKALTQRSTLFGQLLQIQASSEEWRQHRELNANAAVVAFTASARSATQGRTLCCRCCCRCCCCCCSAALPPLACAAAILRLL